MKALLTPVLLRKPLILLITTVSSTPSNIGTEYSAHVVGWRDGGMEGQREGGMEGGRDGWRNGGRERWMERWREEWRDGS